MGDKCELMRPKATRVGDMCGRQVGNKWETSANSCGPRHPEWETRLGDKCKNHVAQDTQSERQVWETSGDKCKLMRPKAP